MDNRQPAAVEDAATVRVYDADGELLGTVESIIVNNRPIAAGELERGEIYLRGSSERYRRPPITSNMEPTE